MSDDELFFAIKRNDISLVHALISRSAIDVNAPIGAGESTATALILAARRGLTEIAALLLSAGAHINATDAAHATAAHAAAQAGHDAVLALILQNSERPDLSLRDFAKRTPLDAALVHGHEKVILQLLAAGSELPEITSGLCGAAGLSVEIVHALVARGVVVRELRYDNERTALHFACSVARQPRLDVLRVLVHECGIDVNVRDSMGHSPCHLAASYGNCAQLGWLVEAGAEIEAGARRRGISPLMLACSNGHVKCTTMLLAYGADASRLDADGHSALQWLLAPFRGVPLEHKVAIAHLLVVAGVDVDATRQNGPTGRELLSARGLSIEEERLTNARHCIATMRLQCVRARALQVCIGLQSLGLDALSTCEILVHACGRASSLVAFHQWWSIATTVKHFNK